MPLTRRQEAALAAAVAASPGAALRLLSPPGDAGTAGRAAASGHRDDGVANSEAQSRPAAIVTAGTPQDWARIIGAAAGEGLPLVVRGRGWSPAGLGSAPGAVVLSVAAMNGTSWTADGRLRVGGGASAGQAERALAGRGQAVTLPVPSEPGAVGAALAGGVGFTLRRLGMTCDALAAATVVTAAGEVIRVTDETDPELMWALRGGGSGLGLVCDADFDTAPAGPVRVVQQVLGLASAPAALADYDAWTASLNGDVTSVVMLRPAPPLPGLPAAAAGRPAMLVTSVHSGDPASAERDLAPLRGLPGILAERTSVTTLAALRGVTDAQFRHARFGIRTASGWSGGLTAAAAGALTELAAAMPPGESLIEVAAMGGAVASAPRPAAAPGRDARHLLNVMTIWTGDADRDEHLRWAKEARTVITALRDGPAIAPGFADLADLNRPGGYGASAERIAAVRDRLDPHRAFTAVLTCEPAPAGPGPLASASPGPGNGAGAGRRTPAAGHRRPSSSVS